MSNLGPQITFDDPNMGQDNKSSILVSIDSSTLRYYGFDVATYKKRAYGYRYPSRYGQLLSWLFRNSEGWEEIGGKGKKSTDNKQIPLPATPVPTKVVAPPTPSPTKARVPSLKGAMMLKVSEQCTKSGYTMQIKGKSVDTRKCPKCLDASLLGAKKADKFIVICFNRYNPDNKKRCDYTKKYTKK